MSLYTLASLAAAGGGRLAAGAPSAPVRGVSIDSRTLAPGDAFFAIRGVAMDGHRFVPAALARGAVVAVVARDTPGDAAGSGALPAEAPLLVVDEPLAALGRVGVFARSRLGAGVPVVAVTGSVGKTGTKEMLRLAFGAAGSVHASAASYNNHWGVPLSLARMPTEAAAAVFEIGMNHAGEITPLTRMVRPTIAIVTTVASAHLEFFESEAGIADAKAEIFLGLEPGGVAVVPSDNPHTARLVAAAEAVGARVVTFGADGDVTVVASEGGRIEADVLGRRVRYALGDPGAHNAKNSLAVLAALAVAGHDVAAGAGALAAWSSGEGRGRRVPLAGGAVLIDDWFNANPASMAAAIAALGAMQGRRVAILGDMLELGPTTAELHRGLAARLIEADARIVHTVGTMTQFLRDALPEPLRGVHAATSAELAAALPPIAPGDVVLVKGSKGIDLGKVVAAITAAYGGAPVLEPLSEVRAAPAAPIIGEAAGV